MRALDHVDLTPANITGNSLAIPDPTSTAPWWTAGEVAWNSATAYTVGQYAARASTGRVYRAIGNSTNAPPETNPLLWFDEFPVNALAWADMKTSTYTYSASPLAITVRPGAIADIDLEGLVNVDAIRVEVWDAPGGAKIFDETQETLYWSGDLWIAYYFDLPYQRDRLKFRAVPASATSEITVTLIAYDAGQLQVSQIAFGRYVDLGMAEFGLEMQLKNFGGIYFNRFGGATVRDGLVVVDLVGSDKVKARDANRVAEFVRRNRNRVLVWEAADDPVYDYLSTTGTAECSLRADGPTHARMNFTVSGISA